jgi:hypothetical protein
MTDAWNGAWGVSWGASWGSGTPVTTTTYGGWPKGRENFPSNIDPRARKKYDRPLVAQDPKPQVELPGNIVSPEIAENIAIIRRLRAELLITQDTEARQALRQKIEDARKAKERLFALQARQDEDDAFFILH